MNQIRSTVLASLIALGSAALAGAQSAPPVAQARAHQAGHAEGMKAGPGRFARGAQRQLFRGIKLSEQEKTNLKAVRQKYAAENKTLRQQLKPQLEAARAARQKGDTAALKALRTQNEGAREQTKKLLEAERHDLRAALTPDNQAKFDANVAQLQQRVANRVAKKGTRKPGQSR